MFSTTTTTILDDVFDIIVDTENGVRNQTFLRSQILHVKYLNRNKSIIETREGIERIFYVGMSYDSLVKLIYCTEKS